MLFEILLSQTLETTNKQTNFYIIKIIQVIKDEEKSLFCIYEIQKFYIGFES
jgi:hypothetical protein